MSTAPFLPWALLDRVRRGELRRVGDLPDAGWHRAPCHHPEHSPPSMILLPEGVYEHVCPGCGQETRFTVRRPRLQVTSTVATCDLGMDLGFSPGQALECST